MTVGILNYPLGEDYGLAHARRRTPARAYRRALLTKSNPRSRGYMEQLFAEHYPNGRLVECIPSDAMEIILLYPDAIGLGWSQLEKGLPANVPIRVLNGRRREFPFDERARRSLKLRRGLERTMVPEITVLIAAALLTPLLLAADVLRGRR